MDLVLRLHVDRSGLIDEESSIGLTAEAHDTLISTLARAGYTIVDGPTGTAVDTRNIARARPSLSEEAQEHAEQSGRPYGVELAAAVRRRQGTARGQP